jgi:poly(rC)-binding protein 2/3/4
LLLCYVGLTRVYVNKEREGAAAEREGGGEKKLSPAQEALFKVHARIIADVETSSRAAGGEGGSDQEEESAQQQQQQVITRLLVPNNQIGCLLGKGGKIIEQMRQSSGAQIRVLPKDQLPGCALPTDEIVQVTFHSHYRCFTMCNKKINKRKVCGPSYVVTLLDWTPTF